MSTLPIQLVICMLSIAAVFFGLPVPAGASTLDRPVDPVVLTGAPQLRARPMRRITDPLRAAGAQIEDVEGRAPLTIRGGLLRGVGESNNEAFGECYDGSWAEYSRLDLPAEP